LVKKVTPKNFKDWCISHNNKTLIMGVLNITPDSFSDGGKFFSIKNAIKHAKILIDEGSDIIDIGGESTRPGAKPLTVDEELDRVLPIIKEIRRSYKDIIISIDTYKAEVAKKAVQNGANIVNDISGLMMDQQMAAVVASLNVPIIIMHLKGTPQDMQDNPCYNDIILEISNFFKNQVKYAKHNKIKSQNIILDPGIGFGKTIDHNFELIAKLKEFGKLGYPILIGPSRKSFIGATLNLPPDKRIEGTAAAIAVSIFNGANIVRVHDVLQMKRVAIIADNIKAMS